jgi:hypothetical protein
MFQQGCPEHVERVAHRFASITTTSILQYALNPLDIYCETNLK